MTSLALALLIGVAIGVALGALGGGGSILTVPALVYLLGESAPDATTASLVIVGVTSAIAAISYARERQVRWGAGLVFAGAGVLATLGGSHLNRAVPEPVLLLSFAALMIIAGVAMLIKSRPAAGRGRASSQPLVSVTIGGGQRESEGDSQRWPGPAAEAERRTDGSRRLLMIAQLAVAGLLVGFLTGFLGVGGGFLIVPVLTVAFGYRMNVATGTSLLIISLNSAVALASRAGQQDHVDWAVIVPVTIAAIGGSLLGKRVAARLPSRVLSRVFAVLIIAVAAYMGVRALTG